MKNHVFSDIHQRSSEAEHFLLMCMWSKGNDVRLINVSVFSCCILYTRKDDQLSERSWVWAVKPWIQVRTSMSIFFFVFYVFDNILILVKPFLALF